MPEFSPTRLPSLSDALSDRLAGSFSAAVVNALSDARAPLPLSLHRFLHCLGDGGLDRGTDLGVPRAAANVDAVRAVEDAPAQQVVTGHADEHLLRPLSCCLGGG